jgi:hypothetical protein
VKRAPIVLFAGAVAVAACSDLNTSPTHVVSLFVDTLPYPSIVQNDTMRDTTGRIAAMKATAYNLANDSGFATVQFYSLDANLLRITTGTNWPIGGDSAPTTVRVVAQAQTLQTQPFTVNIALRPDTVGTDSISDTSAATFTTSDTAQFIHGFCNGPTSAPMVAWLRHNPGGGVAFLGVDNYIMKWMITSPDSLAGTGAISDTAHLAYIVGTNFLPSVRDTTKGGGFSTRYLTFGAEAFKHVAVDTDTLTVTLQAFATYKFNPTLGAANPVPGVVTVTIKFNNPSTCPPPGPG